VLRKLGLKVFYGDASRHDLLLTAGAGKAKGIILAVNEHEETVAIARMVKKHFPHLSIYARAPGRTQAYELLDAGVDHVYRQTLDTSLRTGIDTLRQLGFSSHQAYRAARTFRHHDEKSVTTLRHLRHDRKTYLSQARQQIADLEQLLLSEFHTPGEHLDAGWDTTSLIGEFDAASEEKE